MVEPSTPGGWPGALSRRRWVILIAIVVGAGLLGTRIGAFGPWNDDRSARPPTSQRQAFGFDAAYSDPDPLVLVVRYGDSSSCPSAAVGHTVLQEPDRVVVTLTRASIPADRACTSDYEARLVRISLAAPLGTREVMDGSRARPVPIPTGLPPFG